MIEPSGETVHRARTGVPALIAACGFVAVYLVTDFVTSAVATSAMPLPNSTSAAAQDWFAGNRLAAVLMGACQAVSVLFLAWFAGVAGRRRSRPWGLVAVGLMLLASICAWVLAAVAPTASPGTVEVLRDANFIAGGTAHVVALGVFAFLTSREREFGRPVRILSTVALVVSVLSLSSLFVFEGAALILLGRLLCMVWAISAGVSLSRHRVPR
ncbi:hypothetical protein HCN51_27285 [Nonomuraea sp. FMUSA5-5]|uniref:DUF998 domain-containing protein n=1 Tax=Nonomuraea composti TaxID=2720023 RepID=A0ABX1BDB2_9ACTN|nr:hypothetical protein [Nonomuraea sp. FMUSA5-5]NJP93108.1 hypothetical protein [Nonomuraea sp. FMUSA5-5]